VMPVPSETKNTVRRSMAIKYCNAASVA
jgi:hypothetical protein